MSSEITTAFVQQYSANVFHLSQQKGSRLRGSVRVESQVGKSAFWDRIGAVTATKLTGRHTDTPQIDTPHSRRRVTLEDYVHADLFDNADKIRTLIDPTSEYLKAFMWAFGRAIDTEILTAASGSAYGGEAGATEVVLPAAQKIASVSGGAGSNLNVLALRRAKQKLDEADVDPSIKRYLALDASMLNSLLGQTEVTSSDYNAVKALVMGEVDTFLGFQFIRTERLLTQSSALAFDVSSGAVGSGAGAALNYVKAVAWAQDGLMLSIGKDMVGRISERSDKNYSMQAFAQMGIGATRMEEEKVVEILCNES